MPSTARLLRPGYPHGYGITGCGPWAEGAPLHQCPHPDCRQMVHRFMCRQHWRMVAKAARDQIWRSWDGGRGGTDARLAALDVVLAESTCQAPD